MQAIATGAGFVAEVKIAAAGSQLLDKLSNMVGAVRDGAEVADLAASNALGNRHRNRCLVDIQPDERAILRLLSPPFLRLATGSSGATLACRMPWERPPTSSPCNAIMGSRGLASRIGLRLI